MTAIPSHAPSDGNGAPRSAPMSAAAGAAIPAQSPTVPGPRRWTPVNQSTNATAVATAPR